MNYPPTTEKGGMGYPPATEKSSIGSMSMPRPASVTDYRENSQISRARRVLIAVLTVQLVLTIIHLIIDSVALAQYSDNPDSFHYKYGRGAIIASLVWAVISLVFLFLFLVFVFQYVRLAILIFSWIDLIQVIVIAVFVGLWIIRILASTFLTHYFFNGIIASIVLIVLAALAWILTLLVIYFGFQMANLLKQHENYQLV